MSMRIYILPLLLCLACPNGQTQSQSDAKGAEDSSTVDAGAPDALALDRIFIDSNHPGDSQMADIASDDLSDTDSGSAITTLLDSVTDHDVTWSFSQAVPVGQFITGDYYVVGPVTVTAISPPPSAGRNGSVINVPAQASHSPWDDRVDGNRYRDSYGVTPPVDLVPGDSLVSSVSVAVPGQVENWLREGNNERSSSPVKSISVLTCLASAPPVDAFRPSYADPQNRIYRLADVNRGLLPVLQPPSALDDSYLEMFTQRLSRPWVDNLMYSFDAQVDYMPMYGREMGRVVSITSLLLYLDLAGPQAQQQEQLLIGFVQHGIDLWGLIRAGHPGWHAHGGHGSGRKWFVVLSGMLLGDVEMAAPTQTYPDLQFGEDMQTALAADTAWGDAWNGATVVYTGHMGIWENAIVSDTDGWGPYEHLPPNQWLGDCIGEGYRRCCTSLAWVGQALAARLINAQDNWDHPAFFAYVDRWMDPAGDADYTQQILNLTGRDFGSSWQAHGQAWDDFVEEMWAQYR